MNSIVVIALIVSGTIVAYFTVLDIFILKELYRKPFRIFIGIWAGLYELLTIYACYLVLH